MDYIQNLFRRRQLADPNVPLTPGFRFDTTGLFDQLPITSLPKQESVLPLSPPDSGLVALRGKGRPYMGQLKGLLETQPNRKDYQLSKLGKALAMASGVIEGSQRGITPGIALGRNLMDTPFENAKTDWSDRANKFKALADIEDKELADQQALEVKIADQQDKDRDNLRQDLLAMSTMDLNDAKKKDLINRGKILGLQFKENELTGYLDLYDLKTGTVTPTKHKVRETPGETDVREFKDFEKRTALTHKNAIILKGMDQAHDQVMQSLREAADERSIRLRSALDSMSPTQRNAAWDGAVKEVMMMNPELADRLFVTDAEGNTSPRKDKNGKINTDLFGIFNGSVKEVMKQRMGLPSTGMPSGGATPRAGEGITALSSAADPMRSQAINWLSTNGYDATDEDSISKWIAQAKQDPSLLQQQTPQVALPTQTTPDIGLEAFKNIPGALQRNIQFGEGPRTAPQVQLTDPSYDVGLARITGLINAIRNAPQDIYGPQTRRR